MNTKTVLALGLALALGASGCSSSSSTDAGTDAATTHDSATSDTGPASTDAATTDTGNNLTDVVVATDTGPAATDTGPADTGPATTDTGTATDTGPATTDGGCTGVELTVMNYEAWCTVTVGSTGTASSAASQTVCVPAGSTVNLAATAASSTFELGTAPWHDVTGDTGSGVQGTVTGTGTSASSATTIAVTTGTACAWICCPFAPGGGGCPTTNQCP